jgi:hypothetical protein
MNIGFLIIRVAVGLPTTWSADAMIVPGCPLAEKPQPRLVGDEWPLFQLSRGIRLARGVDEIETI